MRTNKAQIAYEFLLLFFFLTALFTTGVLLVGAAKERIADETILLHVDDFGRGLQEDFYTAVRMPDGFTRNITLPVTLNGYDYETTLREYNGIYSLELRVQETNYTYRLPSLVINDQLRTPPQQNTIIKQGATLIIN